MSAASAIGLRRFEPDPVGRDAALGERGREDVRRKAHELRAAAPRLAERGQRPAAVALEQRGDGRVHQRGVGAAKAVDGLFLVAHPDAPRRQRGERQKDLELQGAGVLELVDEHQVDLLAQDVLDCRPAEQIQGHRLLVDEVDEPPLALVLCVGFERPGRKVEHEFDRAAQVLPQARMAFDAAGGQPNRFVVLLRRHGRRVCGELRPGPPHQPAPGFQLREGPVRRGFDRLRGLRPVEWRGEEGLDGLLECRFDGRGVACLLLEVRQQPVRAARGTGAQIVGFDTVGPRQACELLDVVEPVEVVEAFRDGHQLGGGLAAGGHRTVSVIAAGGHEARQRAAEGRVGSSLVEHLRLGRNAEIERELGHEVAADRVHGADPRGAEPLRQIDVALLEQARTHALPELRGRLHGERGGDDGLGADRRARRRDRALEVVHEAVRLAGAGARRDHVNRTGCGAGHTPSFTTSPHRAP